MARFSHKQSLTNNNLLGEYDCGERACAGGLRERAAYATKKIIVGEARHLKITYGDHGDRKNTTAKY